MDRIFLRDLTVPCRIGVNPWERTIRQVVKIDLDLETDLREAGRGDDLALTVDYKALRDRIEGIAAGPGFGLLEALAEKIAETCLEEQGIRRVRVRVEKPGALHAVRTVGVEIVREGSDGSVPSA